MLFFHHHLMMVKILKSVDLLLKVTNNSRLSMPNVLHILVCMKPHIFSYISWLSTVVNFDALYFQSSYFGKLHVNPLTSNN